jgi:predicted dehydrogenase
VRWGILATGNIAGVFAEDLARVPDAELVAVGSRTPQAAQAFADRYRIPHAHGSWAQLAADPDVDVVYVATPHSAHHAAARVCLEAGKAVLCEKAFTLDLATATDLVDLARDRGLFLMEAMWMRCNPAIRRLVDLVASGRIGEVRAVHADFGLAERLPPTHRLHARALGGGALLDLGVYPVTFAHLFLGEPAAIAAWATLSPEAVDDNTGMLFGYDSGALATLTCSLVTDTPRVASVSGTTGRVELARGFARPETLVLYRGEEVERIDVPYEGHGYVHEIVEVHRCLGLGLLESPLVPLADTLAVMRTLDAVRARIGVTY